MSLAQTCPKCGAEGRYKGFHKRHVLACERLPSGAELIALLEADVSWNVRSLAKANSAGDKRIVDIILMMDDPRWTKAALNERGRMGKVHGATRKSSRKRRTRGRKACVECKMLLDDNEETHCKFCRMAAAGIRGHWQVEQLEPEDGRWAIVRQRDLHSGRGQQETAS